MPRPLRVGVQLPEVERVVRWSEYVAMARAAEDVGFDSIWVGDHLLYRGDGRPERGPWEAWTLLGALAASTERVELGPLVSCLAFHSPGVLAKMAVTVDEVSGGRLRLGVGAGWNEAEFLAFGLPFDQRYARFAESFDVVRRLLAGERVRSAGRFVSARDAVLLPRPPRRVPLMIGSTGERVLELTLPHVDAWNVWYSEFGNTPEGFAARNARVSEIVKAAGRETEDVARSACVHIVLDHAGVARPVEDGVPPLEGPPERIAAGLRAFADAGAGEAILVVSPNTEVSIRSLGEVLALLDG